MLAGALFAGVPAYAETDPEAEHLAHMPPRPDRGPKLKVAMLVYPRMIMIDLAVPQTVLNIVGSDIHLVGKTMQPVSTDIGLNVTPTCTFADCPTDLDVLFDMRAEVAMHDHGFPSRDAPGERGSSGPDERAACRPAGHASAAT